MKLERMAKRTILVTAALSMAAGAAFAQPDSPDKPQRDRGGPGMRRGDHAPPPDDDGGPPDANRAPGPFPGRPPLWTQLPEPERHQVEKFIEDNFPRMFIELQSLKEQSERRFIFRMTRIAPQMRRIMETVKVDPQRGALLIRERQVEGEIFQTMLQYRQSTDESVKRRLRTKVEELAGQMFDLRHERRAGEVRELETRLDLLKSRLTESQSMRTELIHRHVERILTRPPPPFGEDEEPDAPPTAPPEAP
mgnify:CR=1 FL=1